GRTTGNIDVEAEKVTQEALMFMHAQGLGVDRGSVTMYTGNQAAQVLMRPEYRMCVRPSDLIKQLATELLPLTRASKILKEPLAPHAGRFPQILQRMGALSDDEVLQAVAPTGDSGLADRPFMLTGQQSVSDPSRAPAGKHTAWAYTHGPHGVDWAKEGERHVERMETQMERFAPGFRDLVLARHVMLPGQLEERNRNLVGGDVGAGSYTLDQVIFRPAPSLAPYRTPLRGLYLGSASTFPGGAVHGVNGRAAARAAIREALIPRLPHRATPAPRRRPRAPDARRRRSG
ncbi:MAG: hypothetical protein KY433_02110, partial [Actinobacteria bacterium]|nr:hypothetical protein [Actinomycetota bacterium]